MTDSVRREAVLSSQIEGTQSSLSDLLLFELEEAPGVPFDDVVEVSNYVGALEHGMGRLRGGPSSRLPAAGASSIHVDDVAVGAHLVGRRKPRSDLVRNPTGNGRQRHRENRCADKQKTHKRRGQMQDILEVERQHKTNHHLSDTHQKETETAQSKHTNPK